MTSCSKSVRVACLALLLLLLGGCAAKSDGARQPTLNGNGRVYCQMEVVVGSDVARFTARDAGPAMQKAGAELGTRLLEVVRTDVSSRGTESNPRVIFRELLPPGIEGTDPDAVTMDLLVDGTSGVVYLASAYQTAFFLEAFNIDGTPLPRDGIPVIDPPLADNVPDDIANAARMAARDKYRAVPRPKFDPAKASGWSIERVLLSLGEDEVVMTVQQNGAFVAPQSRYAYERVEAIGKPSGDR